MSAHGSVQDPLCSATEFASLQASPRAPQTLTEKIVQRCSVGLPKGKIVKSGDHVSISPHHCMTHDDSWPVALKFMSMGASEIYDRKQIVMTLDHDIQNKSEANLKKYRQIVEFAKEQGVDFYPAGRGIGHQIMVEEGYCWPGTLVVASDSHSNMYGGLGCVGTPVVRTDAASIWATGRTWWQIPPVARLTFTGALPQGVTGKDVIVALCGLFNKDEVLNHAIEFSGSEETMRTLPIDARLTIANMTTEFGGLSGLFPIDDVLEKWLRYKATEAALYQSGELSDASIMKRFSHRRIDELLTNRISADRDAKFAKYLHLNLSTLSPYVSGPNSVKIAKPLQEVAADNIQIDKAYLVSCTNSGASDLAAAALVFRDAVKANNGGRVRIPEHVTFYIAAASMPEQLAAEEAGDWQAMLDAGAKPLPAGCGPCIGLSAGLLEPGEVGIMTVSFHKYAASDRNSKGRTGSTEAKTYLASPEVVAASALHGKITGPGWYHQPKDWAGVVVGEGDGIREEDRMITAEEGLEKVIAQLDNMIDAAEKVLNSDDGTSSKTDEQLTEILPGFPEKVGGEIIFCDADNINTDGIYPGKYTYQDDITPEKMAEVCMSNYDPAFASIAKPGDILVSGFNFGTGSSREQAATCLVAKQIRLVVAGSFGNIFSRNSINNALMSLEAPCLTHRLREAFSGTVPTASQQSVKEPSQNQESLDSPPPAPQSAPQQEKYLTRRTGWKLTWDARRSRIFVQEGENGKTWGEKVGELPPNVQEIIARGGLEKWVKNEIARTT
ncbi:MAG: hypothetical protein Q9163_002585 [Psora crenata]